jgi:hypothetical protein
MLSYNAWHQRLTKRVAVCKSIGMRLLYGKSTLFEYNRVSNYLTSTTTFSQREKLALGL